jgi:drug/metabolite transporter (DMT)-like permease
MINAIIILSVLCSSVAQIALKKGMMQCDCSFALQASNILPLISALVLNPFIVAGVLLHVAALFTWLYVLKHVEVSYAYPFISMGFVVVLFLSYLLFNEAISLYRIVGVLLIISGIILIGRSAA